MVGEPSFFLDESPLIWCASKRMTARRWTQKPAPVGTGFCDPAGAWIKPRPRRYRWLSCLSVLTLVGSALQCVMDQFIAPGVGVEFFDHWLWPCRASCRVYVSLFQYYTCTIGYRLARVGISRANALVREPLRRCVAGRRDCFAAWKPARDDIVAQAHQVFANGGRVM